jgi:uroporphyrinogen decarboxylase
MRQAGRYLPEYRELRSKTKSFMEAVLTPEIASEITLQPLRRFDLDAAIIFSDILVLPYAMGVDVQFHEGIGPVVNYDFNHSNPTSNLYRDENFNSVVDRVCSTISLVKKSLSGSKAATIGFAGAPWTVACYMLERNRKKGSEFEEARQIAYQFPLQFEKFLDAITDATIDFLIAQIKAGAEAIKLFDSHGGLLGESSFMSFVVKPLCKIVKAIKGAYPNMPIIGFPRRAGLLYEPFVEQTKVDCVAVDHTLPINFIRDSLQKRTVVQGNLDNILLTLNSDYAEEPISKAAEQILKNLANRSPGRFIFNLGHGCLPTTKIENIEFLIKKVKNFEKR